MASCFVTLLRRKTFGNIFPSNAWHRKRGCRAAAAVRTNTPLCHPNRVAFSLFILFCFSPAKPETYPEIHYTRRICARFASYTVCRRRRGRTRWQRPYRCMMYVCTGKKNITSRTRSGKSVYRVFRRYLKKSRFNPILTFFLVFLNSYVLGFLIFQFGVGTSGTWPSFLTQY